MNKINASDFKARCLALLDEVNQTGVILTILKRGKPVAQLTPVVTSALEMPQQALIGSVRIKSDLLEPVIDDSEIDLESDKI